MPNFLKPALIEKINSHGPYTHGLWRGKNDLVIGNEEALQGRGNFLAKSIRDLFRKTYTIKQMKRKVVADIGCYDGWLLSQIEDLPFARLIGVEPRSKNIQKGKFIRKALGIKTRCEFRQGDIENLKTTLSDVRPDIVICAGLLHHLSSPASGIANLYQICGELLFLETICLPFDEKENKYKKILELKDIPYKIGRTGYGFSGHKLESGAYDGSATKYSVVSIPSKGALQMFLSVTGFNNIRVVASPSRYAKIFKKSHRQFSAICLTAKKDTATTDSEIIKQHEKGLLYNRLPEKKIFKIYKALVHNKKKEAYKLVHHLSISIKKRSRNKFIKEIAQSISFAPEDKVFLEFGKLLYFKGLHQECAKVLLSVTRKVNADWRSVYRGFCILSWAYQAIGKGNLANVYKKNCLTANPTFPLSLLKKPVIPLGNQKKKSRI